MAVVRPLRGIRYNPEHIRLGGVLAPPYDVIDSEQREELYARDLRNIVRVDDGMAFDDDEPGINDRYTRAAAHLHSWLELGILVREPADAFYVTEHHFVLADGTEMRRRSLLGRVRALPWEESDVLPHERTLRGPKEDRLALMRATQAQTSPIFCLWRDAPQLGALIDAAMSGPALMGGRTDGEMASEKHLLWVISEARQVAAVAEALETATLYIADGHHRFETGASYAAERRAAEPGAPADADFAWNLVCLADAADPALCILPTHRLVLPRSGAAYSRDDLWMRLDDAWEMETHPGFEAALSAAAALRATHHSFAVCARDGAAVLSRARTESASPRAALDVTVLQEEILGPAGIDEAAVRGGALAYSRNAADVANRVAVGEAWLGFGLNATSTAEVIGVSDAGEVMPQKSTYFYPKVPTGLVLSPL